MAFSQKALSFCPIHLLTASSLTQAKVDVSVLEASLDYISHDHLHSFFFYQWMF